MSTWSQLSFLPMDDKVFVMDRMNGKWVFIDQKLFPLLKLLPRLPELSGETHNRVSALARQFEEAGLGGPSFQASKDFNTLILKLTKVCNYGCRYCYDMETEDKLAHMPVEMAKAILRDAVATATTNFGLTVILHGGEPTLQFPMIQELVLLGEELSKESGKKVIFFGQTNLSRLNDQMVDFFLAHNVRWGISMDGNAEVNDTFRVLRNGEGTYQYFERALQKYPAFVRRCGILTTVTSANDRKLLGVAKHFRDAGMPAWDWSLFQPIGMGRQSAMEFEFNVEAVISSWNELFDAVVAGDFDRFRVEPVLDYVNNFFQGPGLNMCLREQCGAGRDLLSVSYDGTIEACDCIDRTGPMSGLGLVQIELPGFLARARESDTVKEIHTRDVKLGQCKECIWLSVCGGTCLAHAGSVQGIWQDQCAIAMNAFTRISHTMSSSDALVRYLHSVMPKGSVPVSAGEVAIPVSAEPVAVPVG